MYSNFNNYENFNTKNQWLSDNGKYCDQIIYDKKTNKPIIFNNLNEAKKNCIGNYKEACSGVNNYRGMNSQWGLCDKDTEIKSTSKSNVSIHTLEGVTTPMTLKINKEALSILDGYGNPIYTGGGYNYVSKVKNGKLMTGKEICEAEFGKGGNCKSGYCKYACKETNDHRGFTKASLNDKNCPKGQYRKDDGTCGQCDTRGVNNIKDYRTNTCQVEDNVACKTGYKKLKFEGDGWGKDSKYINSNNCLVCNDGYFGGQINGKWYGSCSKPEKDCAYGFEYKIDLTEPVSGDGVVKGKCVKCGDIITKHGTPAGKLKTNSCEIKDNEECKFPYAKNSKGICNVCQKGYKGGVDQPCEKIALELNYAKKTIRFSKGEYKDITSYIKNICNGRDCNTLLRSIDIKNGFEAYLFSDYGFKGRKLILENQKIYSGDSKLLKMTDILSMKIIELPEEDVGVTLFSSDNLDFDFDNKNRSFFKVHIKKGKYNQVDLFNIPIETNGFNSKESCGSNYCTTREECQKFCASYGVKTPDEEIEENKDLKVDECSTRGSPDKTKIKNYKYHPGLDSVGGDIKKINTKDIIALAKACNEDPDCKGFNTMGFLKHTLKDEQKFTRNSITTEGIYTKINTNNKEIQIPEKVLINKPYGCIRDNGECIWNKSKQTIKKNDNSVICQSLYLNSKKVRSLRVYKNYAVTLSNELYIHGTEKETTEQFSSRNIFENFTSTSSNPNKNSLDATFSTMSSSIVKNSNTKNDLNQTPPPPTITLYEGAYDYDALKSKFFDKGYLIKSIIVARAKDRYQCLSGFDRYPVRDLTTKAYDIRYECISDKNNNCVTDVKCGVPGKIQPSVKGTGVRQFNCNDKEKSPEQDKICNLLGSNYNCASSKPTTTLPPTTTKAVCPTFQQLLDVNMPRKKEDYFTNKFVFNDEVLNSHLEKDHPELLPDYVPPTTTTKKNKNLDSVIL